MTCERLEGGAAQLAGAPGRGVRERPAHAPQAASTHRAHLQMRAPGSVAELAEVDESRKGEAVPRLPRRFAALGRVPIPRAHVLADVAAIHLLSQCRT